MGRKVKVKVEEKEGQEETEGQERLLDVAVHNGLRLTMVDVIKVMGDENFNPHYEDYEQTPASVGSLNGFRMMRIVPASVFYAELAYELVALAQPIVRELEAPGSFAQQVAQALEATSSVVKSEEGVLEVEGDASHEEEE